MKKLLYISLLFIVFGSNRFLFAQTISNVNFKFENEMVVITYDLTKNNSASSYNIEIEAYKSPNEKLNMFSATGDFGANISAGIQKKIIWDSRKDGYILNEDVFFQIKANNTDLNIKNGTHVLKSVLFPGWGDYRIRNGAMHATWGVLSYGSVAGALYYNKLSLKNYDKYLTTQTYPERQNTFNLSVKQNKYSKILGWSAAAIWTTSVVRTYIRANKVQQNIKPENSKYYYNIMTTPIMAKSEIKTLNTLLPYDLAMAEAEKLKSNEKYTDARNEFVKASKLRPAEQLPNQKIKELDGIIANIKAIDDKFTALVTSGDSLFSLKKYDGAKDKYVAAKNLKPNSFFLADKISKTEILYYTQIADILFNKGNYSEAITNYTKVLDVDKGNIYALNQINLCKTKQLDFEYNNLIANADKSFNNGDYNSAKRIYLDAKAIKSTDYATNKIALCESKLKDEEYNRLVTLANSAFNNGYWEQAKNYYSQALDYKNTSYVLGRIKDCENKIKDAQYDFIIKQANSLMADKNWNSARDLLKKAQQIKDTDDVRKKIEACESNLAGGIVATPTQYDLTVIYKNCKPGVLLIFDVEYSYFSSKDEIVPIGSGFFFSSLGYGVTNKHVYDAIKNTNGLVYSGDGQIFRITKWLNSDSDLDYAIFKVEIETGQTVTPLIISSSGCKEGEKACIIGNPQMMTFAIKDGIISSFYDENTILHSVPTEGGSSGSPLLNMKGEVIGLHFAGKEGKANNNFATDIRKIPLWRYVR